MELTDTLMGIAMAPAQANLATMVDDMWEVASLLGWAAGWKAGKDSAGARDVYEWLAELQIMRICVAGCELEHAKEIKHMARRCVNLFTSAENPELAFPLLRVLRGLGGALC